MPTPEKAVAERQAIDARRADEEAAEFAYAASHDLREPLRNLISYVQLLKEDLPGELPADAQQDLKFITESAARMTTLVDGLLDLSRTGCAVLNKQKVPLDDCVREALKTLSQSVEEHQVSLEHDTLPVVWGDRRLLAQIYENLLTNAVRFRRPDVPPRIQITAEEGEREWVLGVRDNGIGISPQYATTVFAPFKRLHGMNEFEGTGVGLTICRKAVELHGGRIWVESELGQGANFRFTLPVMES
jgi:light-regulated signal transduction histidine kinase (bacteriophytochrome)